MPSPINQKDQATALLILLESTDDNTVGNPYDAFKERYFNDLEGFVRECFDWREHEQATPYQNEALRALVNHKRVSIRGPHGLGKTAFAAWVILWFALTREGLDWKIPCTASSWRQLVRYLWPEIKKWGKKILWEKVGREPLDERRELLSVTLKLNTGEAFALASDKAALMEGAHANHILYVFDEAKTIPADTWDAAEGAMSSGEAYMLAISTPGEPSGRFYEIHSRKKGLEDWWVKHVTMEDAIKAGRMDAMWAQKRKEQWGEDSAVYKNRVKGEFASSDEDTVITLAMVERANERWALINDANGFGEITDIGADIGRGGDPSVICYACGDAIKEFKRLTVADVMEVAGHILVSLKAHIKARAVIDIIGIGAGVFDRLKENKDVSSRVFAFNASAKSEAKDRSDTLGFINMRSAGWWAVREKLEDDELALPPNDDMIGELTSPKWRVSSGGKIQVEGKEDIKKRIGRSTNYADTVVQVCVEIDKGTGNWVRHIG